MASSKLIAAYFYLIMASLGVVTAIRYYVGDGAGWAAGIDYVAWASKYTFYPGDNLRFVYDHHAADIDVQQVTEESFIKCKTDGNSTRIEGTRFLLEHSGMYYFINGYPDKCSNGWKLQVHVSAANPSRRLSLSALSLLPWLFVFSIHMRY